MHNGDVGAADPEGDLDLPLVYRLAQHPYTPAQLVVLDLAAVVVLSVVFEVLLPRQVARVSGPAWDGVALIGYVVASVSTLFRRRFPEAAFLVISVIAIFSQCLRASGPTIFYLALVLYPLFSYPLGGWACLRSASPPPGCLRPASQGAGGQVIPISIGGLTLMGIGWLAGENTRASRNYAAARKGRAIEAAATMEHERAEQLQRAVSDERVKIARELHDIVAHAMSVIAVRSGVARMVIDTQPEQAREALTIIETTTRRSLQEMRLLVGVLRSGDDNPTTLEPAPGLADLDRLLSDMAVLGVHAHLEVHGVARALPPAADLSAYRIVQEALTNVARHAGPTRAGIRITYRPDEIVIEVLDDGPSSASPPATLPRLRHGHGLIGMQERAALFGGKLTAGPSGRGFKVKATLHTGDQPSADSLPRGGR